MDRDVWQDSGAEFGDRPRRSGRGILFAGIALSLTTVAAVVAVAVWAPWRQAAGSLAARVNQDDLAAARDVRAAALRQVWRTLEEFRAANGAWPADLETLRAFAPIIDDVLAPPPLSEHGAYSIDFAALNAPPARGPARIIVDDPGYRVPGAAGDPSALEPFRVVLLQTGEALMLEEARRRGAREAHRDE
jgi:hypothetical protein